MDFVLGLGIIIFAGFVGGMLAKKLRFPMITGYIIVGILLSPSISNVISQAIVDDLDVFTSIALGIIAYSIGSSLRIELIRALEKSIIWIGTAQGLMAFAVSILAITFLAPLFLNIGDGSIATVYLPIALVIGAMASATAPAAIMAIIHEYKAKGPLTTTLLSVVAFDDGIAVILFSIALGIATSLSIGSLNFSAFDTLLFPVLEILGSIAIGICFGFILSFVAKLVKRRALLLVLVLGTIILSTGIVEYLDWSAILTNMVIGFVVVNRLKREEIFSVIDDIEDVIFAMYFVLAGLHFDWEAMQTAGILGILILFSRFFGKYLGTRAGAQISNAPEVVKKYLGFALMPAAGVTIGLALLAQRAFPEFGAIVFNAILVSVIINELISPPLVKFAIEKAGEKYEEVDREL